MKDIIVTTSLVSLDIFTYFDFFLIRLDFAYVQYEVIDCKVITFALLHIQVVWLYKKRFTVLSGRFVQSISMLN